MQEIVHSRFALFTMGTDDIKKDYVFFLKVMFDQRGWTFGWIDFLGAKNIWF